MNQAELFRLQASVRALLSEAYKDAVECYGEDDIRCYGVTVTDALSSHRAAVNWGIDTYSYRDVQGWDYADASAQWDVRRFAVWSEDGGASINELIRQRNARATVDSYEDILVGVASAIRAGMVEARLPVPGFLRLNTNGGVTTPVLEGCVTYAAGDEVYEM